MKTGCTSCGGHATVREDNSERAVSTVAAKDRLFWDKQKEGEIGLTRWFCFTNYAATTRKTIAVKAPSMGHEEFSRIKGKKTRTGTDFNAMRWIRSFIVRSILDILLLLKLLSIVPPPTPPCHDVHWFISRNSRVVEDMEVGFQVQLTWRWRRNAKPTGQGKGRRESEIEEGDPPHLRFMFIDEFDLMPQSSGSNIYSSKET